MQPPPVWRLRRALLHLIYSCAKLRCFATSFASWHTRSREPAFWFPGGERVRRAPSNGAFCAPTGNSRDQKGYTPKPHQSRRFQPLHKTVCTLFREGFHTGHPKKAALRGSLEASPIPLVEGCPPGRGGRVAAKLACLYRTWPITLAKRRNCLALMFHVKHFLENPCLCSASSIICRAKRKQAPPGGKLAGFPPDLLSARGKQRQFPSGLPSPIGWAVPAQLLIEIGGSLFSRLLIFMCHFC